MPASRVLVSGALGLVALFVALAAHECGHIFAGLAAGFRFRFWAAGPFFLVENDRGRLRLGWNRDAFLWGGVAATAPVDTRNLFLGTAIPMKNGAFLTDGARTWRLVRGGPHAAREESLLALEARWSRGERPRDWSQATVEQALVPPDGSLYELNARFWAYARAVDAGDVATAAPHVRRVAELMHRLPASLRAPFACEVAWWGAAHGGRADEASQLLAAIPASSPWLDSWDRLRAEAAIARAEDRAGDAADAVERALESAPPTASFCRARLEEMRTPV